MTTVYYLMIGICAGGLAAALTDGSALDIMRAYVIWGNAAMFFAVASSYFSYKLRLPVRHRD